MEIIRSYNFPVETSDFKRVIKMAIRVRFTVLFPWLRKWKQQYYYSIVAINLYRDDQMYMPQSESDPAIDPLSTGWVRTKHQLSSVTSCGKKLFTEYLEKCHPCIPVWLYGTVCKLINLPGLVVAGFDGKDTELSTFYQFTFHWPAAFMNTISRLALNLSLLLN